nr:hypothetical protein OADCBASZ_OADCBASZ_CDS_0002 [Microvirus sp.]
MAYWKKKKRIRGKKRRFVKAMAIKKIKKAKRTLKRLGIIYY